MSSGTEIGVSREKSIRRRQEAIRLLVLLILFHMLIVLGLWKGDFRETKENGSTL